eukprot:326637_1
MEPKEKNSAIIIPPKKGRLRFWKKTPNKTPGSIKQVRGAQYPPIMNKNNPYKTASGSNKKRHSASVTLKSASMSDSHLNYKHTNNPPLSNNQYYHNKNNKTSPLPINNLTKSSSADNNNAHNIDINELIQSAKEERQKQLEDIEENDNKHQLNGSKSTSNGHGH